MSDTKKHPILLVDDEPEMLYSLKGLLRREFELYTAESGQAALAILQQHPVHVIMTDQRMPEMTGIQLMRQVKTEYPQAVRIIFTGYADLKSVVEGINHAGLYRYITKPWDPDELIQVLHEAADVYEQLVERQRLLVDLGDQVRRGQSLAQELGQHLPAGAQAGLDEFLQNGSQLLQRLDHVLGSHSPADP